MTRMLRWDKGREAIDAMLARRHLEQVPSNADHAQRLLAQARTHIASASALRSSDSELAFRAAYDSARKALTALLAVQGLRPTSSGGHVVVYQAALAQFDPPLGGTIKPFEWMRRTRNDVEYPRMDAPGVDPDEVDDAISAAGSIVEMVSRLAETMPPYGK